MQDGGSIPGPIRPCPAAMGMIGVPARRWLTKADLYAQLDAAKTFMDTCDLAEVNLADCAGEAGLLLHHFLRLFHEVHNVTPHQYLSARRIWVAKGLLEETDLTVSEIAVEVGFGGASAFGRMFKQQLGCSPTQYRSTFPQDR